MAWVRFTADHDHRVGASTVAYKAGMRCNVTRACRDEAVALGRAAAIRTPGKAAAQALAADPRWTGGPDGTEGRG